MVTVESNFQVKKDVYIRNKEYQQSLMKQHDELSNKLYDIEKNQRDLRSTGSQVEELQ